MSIYGEGSYRNQHGHEVDLPNRTLQQLKMGTWELLHHGEPVQMLIERADACLYAAKRNGRNQVICETDPEVAAPSEKSVA